jgi:hypothetical protein
MLPPVESTAMAVRLRRDIDELTRKRIKTTQLVKRLLANALGELPAEMSSGQIKSAEILLKKVLPDLQAMTLKGDEDAPLKAEHEHTVRFIDPKVNDGV